MKGWFPIVVAAFAISLSAFGAEAPDKAAEVKKCFDEVDALGLTGNAASQLLDKCLSELVRQQRETALRNAKNDKERTLILMGKPTRVGVGKNKAGGKTEDWAYEIGRINEHVYFVDERIVATYINGRLTRFGANGAILK